MRWIGRNCFLAFGVGLLVACSDRTPPLPSESVISRIATSDRRTSGRSDAFVCVTYVAAHGGAWRGNSRRIRFPASELAPGGHTIAYRYRGYTPENRIVATADCRIPATEAAIRRMNRRFSVETSHRIPRRSGTRAQLADGPKFSTELDAVGLETLVATAKWCGPGMVGQYPYCRPILSATAPGAQEEDDPGWGDWTWEDPDYDPDDGTGREPCVYDAPGHCVTRELTQDEWNRLLAAIERIKETSPECAGAKQALRGLAAQGPSARRFRFWDGYDIREDPKTGQRTQRVG